MRNAILFVLFIVSFSCKQSSNTTPDIHLISPQEMTDLLMMEEVQLIDVRTPKEFEGGAIANAKNINFLSDDFESKIEKLDKDKPICVYCKKGGRSAKAAKRLKEIGFKKIYDLEGGITNWEDTNKKGK